MTASRMNSTHFCKFCRELQADKKKNGYVLVDLYDLAAIQIYPISPSAEYEIRCYSVTIEENKDQLSITEAGNLE